MNAPGNNSFVVWFTGLSGAGKTSVAGELEAMLRTRSWPAAMLDGDRLRSGLNADLGYDSAARRENVRRIGHVAALMRDAGVSPLVACISPHREERDLARSLAPAGRFVEVWVDTPLDVCRERDPKLLYLRHSEGLVRDMVGVDVPYEAPLDCELKLNTAGRTSDESAALVLDCLERLGLLVADPLTDRGEA